jgi:hypothetical protein
VVELHELALKLAHLDPNITYMSARDLLTEQEFKLRRLVAPFANKPHTKKTSDSLLSAITAAKSALAGVMPSNQPDSSKGELSPVVYFAIEGPLSDISGLIGDLIGFHETTLGSVTPATDAGDHTSE